MAMRKKSVRYSKVALELKLAEKRFCTNNGPLKIRSKGIGPSVPMAISDAVREAFKAPKLKGKSPTYIDFSVVVTSRWNFDSMTAQQLQEAEDRLLDFATQTSK